MGSILVVSHVRVVSKRAIRFSHGNPSHSDLFFANMPIRERDQGTHVSSIASLCDSNVKFRDSSKLSCSHLGTRTYSVIYLFFSLSPF